MTVDKIVELYKYLNFLLMHTNHTHLVYIFTFIYTKHYRSTSTLSKLKYLHFNFAFLTSSNVIVASVHLKLFKQCFCESI